VRRDRSIRALLINAAGKAFSVGARAFLNRRCRF
jgi:enoyl-CoA hydratase/carnithine racemase